MNVRPDLVADIITLALPPRTVDEVRLHHVFEHFNRVVALGMLIRWQSWLKPGGTLVIETPDFEYEARAFLGYRDDPGPTGPFSFRDPRRFLRASLRKVLYVVSPRRSKRTFSDRMSAIRSLEGDQSDAWAYHVGHWFAERFKQTLGQLGFSNVAIEHRLSGHAPPLHNILVRAIRAGDRTQEDQLDAAYALLWNSIVSDVERRTWEVWCKQLKQFLTSDTSPTMPTPHKSVPEIQKENQKLQTDRPSRGS